MTGSKKRGVQGFLVVCFFALALTLLSLFGLSARAETTPATLRVLQKAPRHVTDKNEDPEKRDRRLRELQSAVDAATSIPHERAALLTLLRHESHAAAYVHEGRCADGPRGVKECDSGRAKGPWQLQGKDVPDTVEGQAERAITLWRYHLKSCSRVVPNAWEGAYSGYASGGKCAWPGAPRRVATMRAILAQLGSP